MFETGCNRLYCNDLSKDKWVKPELCPYLDLPMQWSRRSGQCEGSPDIKQALLERLHGENQMNKEKWTKLW